MAVAPMPEFRILFLGPEGSPICQYLRSVTEYFYQQEDSAKIETPLGGTTGMKYFDFIVSHGYRYIIPPRIIELYPDSIINCHISLLPHNRGADPNFWSWAEDTLKGVSIHYVDEGIDTGPILVQKNDSWRMWSPTDTLESSYEFLQLQIAGLFKRNWDDIKKRRLTPIPQPPGGSYHNSADLKAIWDKFPLGWQTPVKEIPKILEG